jgi:hypothetical protein
MSAVRRVNPSVQSDVRSPTTKAVGSNFVISIEPTALVVGARILSGFTRRKENSLEPYRIYHGKKMTNFVLLILQSLKFSS